MFFTSGLAVVSYVLLAWGMYSIAKRRGINKPWLGWIPVANIWLLGCISDQYRQVARGQVKAKRKAMLTLTIIMYSVMIIVIAIAIVWLVGLLGHMDLSAIYDTDWSNIGDMTINEITEIFTSLEKSLNAGTEEYVMSTLWMPLVMAGLSLAMSGVAIALMVLEFMAYADLFASCDPRTAKLFTALGIVLSLFGMGIVLSIFVFLNKDKDFGMPPKPEQEPAVSADIEM